VLFVIFNDAYGISLAALGALVLYNFGVQLVVDVFAVKFADRIGYRRLAVTAHALAAAGLVLMGVLPRVMPAYAGLLASVTLYSTGSGLIEVLISPIVDSLPNLSEKRQSSMSFLHSFYCWGQLLVILLSTAYIKIFGGGMWYVLPIVWAAVPAANLLLFARVPLMPAVPEAERTPLSALFKSRLFLLAVVLMAGAGASEQAMAQWASIFAEKGLGVSKIVGDLLGPCLFALTMALGRMAFGAWGAKLNLRKFLAFGSALCVACYLAAAFSPWPAIGLAACALCGLSVSLLWPGMLSMTSAKFPAGGTAMFGVLAIAGDVGCASGPFLSGLASEAAGLKSGMLVSAVFPVVMLAGLILFGVKRLYRG